MTHTYHLITFGCQMNKSDSQRIASVLECIGLHATSNPAESDVVVINTCSVRQSAEDRVYGVVRACGELRKKTNRNLIIAVTGCMPGRDRDGRLKEKLPDADLFFPIADITKLPRWISELYPTLVQGDGGVYEDYLKVNPLHGATKGGFVTIQTGCNKFCTYCVVPFARGFERNRPVADILDEIHALASQGCSEVTLLGQTVNSFRAVDAETFSPSNPFHDHFAALLYEVNQIAGITRVHFTAPHPLHMTDDVIEAMALPAHVRYVHLPVQSGDNGILAKMNRRYTREYYIELVHKIRDRLPHIALGTDIIVGYCGETEQQFEQTVDLYRQCDFDISYTAMYSPRSGTVAYNAWEDDVPRYEKKRRWRVLQELMEETALRKNQAYCGGTVEVLVDGFERVEREQEQGWCAGNSREMKHVKFPGTHGLMGTTQIVRIARAQEWVLYGKHEVTV